MKQKFRTDFHIWYYTYWEVRGIEYLLSACLTLDRVSQLQAMVRSLHGAPGQEMTPRSFHPWKDFTSPYLATGISMASAETKSISKQDVHLLNTELAMHYRVILKINNNIMATFGFFVILLWTDRDFVAMFWSIFLVIKAKQNQCGCCFLFKVLHELFFVWFNEKIEFIGQIRLEWKFHV